METVEIAQETRVANEGGIIQEFHPDSWRENAYQPSSEAERGGQRGAASPPVEIYRVQWPLKPLLFALKLMFPLRYIFNLPRFLNRYFRYYFWNEKKPAGYRERSKMLVTSMTRVTRDGVFYFDDFEDDLAREMEKKDMDLIVSRRGDILLKIFELPCDVLSFFIIALFVSISKLNPF